MGRDLFALPAWLAGLAMWLGGSCRTAFPGRPRGPGKAVLLPVLLAGFIPAGLCLAEQEPGNVPQAIVAVVRPARLSEYWLGLVSEPVPDALRAQLNLPEDQGLLVEQVAPQSPAAAAGLQQYDILLKADGKAIVHVGDLISAVDAAKGKVLTLEIVRKGKPMKVEVTPAKRPEGEIAGLLPPTPAEQWGETMRKWAEQFRPGDPHHRDYSLFFLRPGVVLARPRGLPDLPNDVTISITKQGNQPAKIVVTRGKEKWELTEGKLDALPPELRPHVEGMLRSRLHGALTPSLEDRLPSGPGSVHPVPSTPRAEPRKALEKQLDDMNRRLEEMRKAVDELKQSKPPAASEAGGDKK